ncbi:hypothetical protein Tco_0861667 [Tanacetum coccineum]|uniref:Uncharacterized protein n=1 Tax=Tanacetum coccineum TaxID=301880 RepID=A0ABQ5BIG9_9ASTR
MTEKCIWLRLCGVEKVLTLPEFVVLLGLYEEDEVNHGLFAIHFTKLEVDDKLFKHEAFWQNIRKPTSTNPRTSLIKEPLMRIVHKLLLGSLVHRAAWVIAGHLCKHALGLKDNSLICGGHYVTKIAHSLGYLNEEEVAKCSKPIEYETWTVNMLENKLDEGTYTLMKTEQEASQPAFHAYPLPFSDQSNFAYPAYEPPNVPPYPYRYVPYPHPYTHYLDTGSPSFGGDHYGAHGDGYNASSIVPSSGYEIRGSSAGFHGEDFDPITHSEDCVERVDDEMRD